MVGAARGRLNGRHVRPRPPVVGGVIEGRIHVAGVGRALDSQDGVTAHVTGIEQPDLDRLARVNRVDLGEVEERRPAVDVGVHGHPRRPVDQRRAGDFADSLDAEHVLGVGVDVAGVAGGDLEPVCACGQVLSQLIPQVVVDVRAAVGRARPVIAVVPVPAVADIGGALVHLVLVDETVPGVGHLHVVAGVERRVARVPEGVLRAHRPPARTDPVIAGAKVRAAGVVAHGAEGRVEQIHAAAKRTGRQHHGDVIASGVVRRVG